MSSEREAGTGNRWQTACRYSRRERAAIEAHIARYFGQGELTDPLEIAPGFSVDLVYIPPRPEADHDYQTLVTIGLGAWEGSPVQIELLVNLPADWPLDETSQRESRWSWPLRMLADAVRRIGGGLVPEWGELLPWEGERYDDTTRLCGAVLLYPGVFTEDSFGCPLPDGSEVGFAQLIPLYPEELEAAEEEGMDPLLENCPDDLMEVIDPCRVSIVLDREAICCDDTLLDEARLHLAAIRYRGLPVEELAAYSHMAVYLGWCLDQDLASEELREMYDAALAEAEAAGEPLDLRVLLRDRLEGRLTYRCLNDRGIDFSDWYNAGDRSAPYDYLTDLTDYARERLGPEPSEEAYLLLPYDETCRREVEALISRRYRCWLEREDGEDGGDGETPPEDWAEKAPC